MRAAEVLFKVDTVATLVALLSCGSVVWAWLECGEACEHLGKTEAAIAERTPLLAMEAVLDVNRVLVLLCPWKSAEE